jgi:hypothetical protein
LLDAGMNWRIRGAGTLRFTTFMNS